MKKNLILIGKIAGKHLKTFIGVFLLLTVINFISNDFYRPVAAQFRVNQELNEAKLVLESETVPLGTEMISGKIINSNQAETCAAGAFIVERFNGSQWREVSWKEKAVIWPDLCFDLDAMVFNLAFFEIEESGLYRIRTYILQIDNWDEPHDLVAEFYVQY